MSVSNQHGLSPQFSEYTGNANLKDPGAPTEVESICIQKDLVESFCISEDKHSPLQWIPPAARQNPMGQAIGQHFISRDPVGNHHTAFSTSLRLTEPIKTFVDLYCHVHKYDFMAAVSALASMYGFSTSQLFGDVGSNMESTSRVIYQNHQLTPQILDRFIAPDNLNIEGISYSKGAYPIVFNAASAGHIFEVIRYFRNDGAEIHIPVHPTSKQNIVPPPGNNSPHGNGTPREQYKFKYGLGPGKIPLYNLDFLDNLK